MNRPRRITAARSRTRSRNLLSPQRRSAIISIGRSAYHSLLSWIMIPLGICGLIMDLSFRATTAGISAVMALGAVILVPFAISIACFAPLVVFKFARNAASGGVIGSIMSVVIVIAFAVLFTYFFFDSSDGTSSEPIRGSQVARSAPRRISRPVSVRNNRMPPPRKFTPQPNCFRRPR